MCRNNDPNSDWSKSRLAWSTQLLIRFGKLDSQKDIDGNIPDYFNAELLTKLVPEQIVWWDESHFKCVIGGQGVNRQGSCYQLKRDKNGKLDSKGEYAARPEELNVKYEEESESLLPGCWRCG